MFTENFVRISLKNFLSYPFLLTSQKVFADLWMSGAFAIFLWRFCANPCTKIENFGNFEDTKEINNTRLPQKIYQFVYTEYEVPCMLSKTPVWAFSACTFEKSIRGLIDHFERRSHWITVFNNSRDLGPRVFDVRDFDLRDLGGTPSKMIPALMKRETLSLGPNGHSAINSFSSFEGYQGNRFRQI